MVKKILYIYLILNSGYFVFAQDDFCQIKGLYTILKEKKHVSPLHGFVWWKTHQIEAMYCLGDQNDNMIKLIHELFYLNPWDGITFGCTILPSKIGKYITPRAIGIIINAIEQWLKRGMLFSEIDQLKQSLIAKLNEELVFDRLIEKTKINQMQLQQEYEQEIMNCRKKAQILTEKKVKLEQYVTEIEVTKNKIRHEQNIVRQQKNALKKKRLANEKIKEEINQKDQTIRCLQNNVDIIVQDIREQRKIKQNIKNQIDSAIAIARRLENKIKNAALSSNSLEHLVELIIGSLHEQKVEKKYFPYTLHNILLSFLYAKKQKKKEFLDYFDVVVSRDIISLPAIFDQNSLDQHAWLSDSYTSTCYFECVQALRSILPEAEQNPLSLIDFVLNNYEVLVSGLYSYEMYTNIFPPQAIAGWARYKDIQFPDCVSNSLLNCFNNLMYDYKKGFIDFSSMQTLCRLHPKLEHFCETRSSIGHVQSEDTRNAWVYVTSDLNDDKDEKSSQIDYKTPSTEGVCEITARGGIKNIYAVLKKLLGVNDINELIQKVANKKQVAMQFEPSQDPNFGIYSFILDNQAMFKWHLDPAHFYVEAQPYYYTSEPVIDRVMDKIFYMLISTEPEKFTQINTTLLNMLMLYRDKQNKMSQVMEKFVNNTVLSENINQIAMLFYNLRNNKSKIDFLRAVLQNPALRSNFLIFSLAERVKDNLIQDDEKYHKDVIQVLLSSSVQRIDDYPYKNKVDKWMQEGMAVLQNKYPEIVSDLTVSLKENI